MDIKKWEEEFDKKFNVIDTDGIIWGKDHKITLDNNYNQLGAIKQFIAELLK